MTPLRRLVAEHMVFSKRTSPHVGTVAEIDFGGVARQSQHHRAILGTGDEQVAGIKGRRHDRVR